METVTDVLGLCVTDVRVIPGQVREGGHGVRLRNVGFTEVGSKKLSKTQKREILKKMGLLKGSTGKALQESLYDVNERLNKVALLDTINHRRRRRRLHFLHQNILLTRGPLVLHSLDCREARISGEVAERPIAPVLKTGVPERVPGVRIPPSPKIFCLRNVVCNQVWVLLKAVWSTFGGRGRFS